MGPDGFKKLKWVLKGCDLCKCGFLCVLLFLSPVTPSARGSARWCSLCVGERCPRACGGPRASDGAGVPVPTTASRTEDAACGSAQPCSAAGTAPRLWRGSYLHVWASSQGKWVRDMYRVAVSQRQRSSRRRHGTCWSRRGPLPGAAALGGVRSEATMRTAPRGDAHLLCSLPASRRLPASLLLSPRSLPAWEEAPAYGPLRTGSGAEPDDRPCAAVLSLRVTLHDTCT